MHKGKRQFSGHVDQNKPGNVLHGLVLLISLFFLSRILYSCLGLDFIYPGGLETFPQLISGHLLRSDLWRSLFYLHSQPPLFNLFVGMILQLFPGYEMYAFQVAYLVIGLVCTVSLYLVLVNLSVSTWISFLLTTGFILSPGAFYHETNINYEYPVMAMLLLSVLGLVGYLKQTGKHYLLIFMTMTACIVLTRTIFQIIWLVFSLLILFYFRKDDWKTILRVCSIPLLLVFAWYLKNYLLFGQLTTSSWAGMNFSRITMYCIPEEWRIAMVDQYEISELGRLRSIFDYPLELHQEQKWDIPVLDEVYKMDGRNDYNFNNINIIQASKDFMRDSLVVLKKYPRDYIYCVLFAQYIYFQPPYEYDKNEQMAPLLLAVEKIYHKAFYSSWIGELESLTQHRREDVRSLGKWLTSSTFLFCGYFASFTYLFVSLMKIVKGKLDKGMIQVVLVYLTGTMFYITLVGTMLDIGENSRFRYMADPFFIIVLGVALDRSIRFVYEKVKVFRHNRGKQLQQ